MESDKERLQKLKDRYTLMNRSFAFDFFIFLFSFVFSCMKILPSSSYQINKHGAI